VKRCIVWVIAATLLSGISRAQGPIQVHGLIQGRFTDQEGTPDRLEIRRARLVLSGDPVSKLSYRFQVDFVKRPYLMDLSLAWKFSRAFTFAAGQMKIPFSAESLLGDNLNQPVARSRAVLSLSPGRDTGVQGRDVGAQGSGTIHLGNGTFAEYAAGVFRGQTFVYAPKVHYNATTGRFIVHPLHGLAVGGDWYGSFSAPPHLVKRREEIEGQYDRGRGTIRAEQIWARDGSLERRGGYLLGVWRVRPFLETIARADWLTTDVHKPNSSSIAYVAGGNVFIGKHLKIGMDAGAQHDQGPRGWSSVFVAQVMPYF
jgi:hypothetical protein